jgi:hypothetical protein
MLGMAYRDQCHFYLCSAQSRNRAYNGISRYVSLCKHHGTDACHCFEHNKLHETSGRSPVADLCLYGMFESIKVS